MNKVNLKSSHAARRIFMTLGSLLLAALLAQISIWNSAPATPPNFEMPESVLFQVRGEDSRSVLAFVIADGATDWYQLPMDLLVGKGNRIQELSETASSMDIGLSAKKFTDATGLEISESWQLDRLALVALVDAVGGVSITSEEEIVLTTEKQHVITVQENTPTHLNGIAAALYATSGFGAEQGKRFFEVWKEVLTKTDASHLETILSSVGSSSRASMDLSDLVNYFEKLQQIFDLGYAELQPVTSYLRQIDGAFYRELSDETREALIKAGVQVISNP